MHLTYRPKGNLVWAATALILDALFLTQAVFYPLRGDNLIINLVVAAAIALAAYALWVRPKLVLREADLVVVNPLKAEVIAYSAIEELETKWALLILHDGKATRVWVAPTNGKYRWIADSNQRLFFNRMPRSDRAVGEITPISESHSSDSGVAASLIRERIEGRH
ncbi:MAG: hypothetical protein RLZ28_1297 [Actinomycetota bacterium]|jgi:hypothetical protein